MTTCGTFKVEHEQMKPNEQFGFYTKTATDTDEEDDDGSPSLGYDSWTAFHSSGETDSRRPLGNEEKEELSAALQKDQHGQVSRGVGVGLRKRVASRRRPVPSFERGKIGKLLSG